MNDQDKIFEKIEALIDQTTELREKSFLSQKQVATILGLSSHASIHAIEKKKTMPRLDTILKILSVYGYTLKIVPDEK